ncbi:DUF4352 domain-containing protein [Aneurinibacillus aneurinilyticus]|uniref:DUF4352 domain-containing protein n=1 Tax=Aneurinibacillus aneurinilyticus TaxID=1391 RepID=UPI00366AE834
MKKPIYKRWWFWLLALIVVFAAIGSNGEEKTQQAEQSTAQPTNSQPKEAAAPAEKPKAETPAKTYKVGEAVQVDNFTYTVSGTSNKKQIGNEYLNKKTENTFLVIDVAIKNGDKEARMMDTSLFKLKDANGTEYDPMAEADMYVNGDSPLFLANVNPGLTKKGKVVFELPTDAKGLQLVVSSGLGFSGGKTELINLGK